MAKRRLVEIVLPSEETWWDDEGARQATLRRLRSFGLDPERMAFGMDTEIHFDGRNYFATYLEYDVGRLVKRLSGRIAFPRPRVTRKINYRLAGV